MLLRRTNKAFLTRYKLVRFISCNSCGIELQNKDPKQTGYFIKPKERSANKAQSLEDIKYLLFSQSSQESKHDHGIISPSEVKIHKQSKNFTCKRCSDVLHKNQYSLEDFQKYSFEEISQHIPPNSNIFHVAPLSEFPLHVDRSVLLSKDHNASLLLSKGDQISTNKTMLQKKAPQFFKDFCKHHLGFDTNKTVTFSALKHWNIQSVFSVLTANSYLVGAANVGKSTLVNSLLKKYLGIKLKTDKNGKDSVPEFTKEELENPNEFLKQQSAGVSHVPNMTRNIQPYKIQEKILYDLPGYTKDASSPDLETIIEEKWLERIRKTSLFKTSKLVKQSYTSLKGTANGKCYTLGGIFYLVPPPNTINQVIKYIPGEDYEFKNFERALEVLKKTHENPDAPLKKYFGVLPHMCSRSQYVRHVIPPFQGSIEIVFKNIGYIQLKTTGTYKFVGLHELWIPRGIDVCIREPLAALIENGFDEHVHSRGLKSSCPERPIISSTYPMPADEKDTLRRMREMFLERTNNNIMARRFANKDPFEIVGKLHSEPPNLYWYYVW